MTSAAVAAWPSELQEGALVMVFGTTALPHSYARPLIVVLDVASVTE